ncbi:hypothetical protein NBRC116493_16780 [Aurantivibrio infirmus]
MILLASIEEQINCSSSSLFDYVTDMENYIHWFPGVIDVKESDNLPKDQVGKQYLETLSFPTGPQKLTIEVKQFERNRFFVMEGDLEPILPRMMMKFDAMKDNTCKFSLSYFSRSAELDSQAPLIQALQASIQQRLPIAIQALKEKFS